MAFLSLFLLLACGRAEPYGASPALEVVPFVATSLSGEAFVCAQHAPAWSLGVVQSVLVAPNGLRAAVVHSSGVELVSLTDRSSLSLGGPEVTLEGARWSDDSERLAYFVGGVPRVTSGSGQPAFVVNAELPADWGDGYSFQAAEWARDGQKLAFVSGGLGILVDAAGEGAQVFSRVMVRAFGTPWPVAFSADGQYLVGLQATTGPIEQRSVLMLDTEAFLTRQSDTSFLYTLLGWTADDAAALVWADSAVLVPRDGGELKRFAANMALPSPSAPELALGGPGLRVVNLLDGSERRLLPDSVYVQAIRWQPDGATLSVFSDSAEHSGYVSAADGTRLASGAGVVGPDGWVALPDLRHTDSGLITQNLHDPSAAGGHFAMRFPEGESGGDLVTAGRVSWLHDGGLVFVSDDGAHVAAADGSHDSVVCTGVDGIVTPQTRHWD